MVLPLVLALCLYYRPVVNSDESLRQRIASFFAVGGGNLFILMGFGVLLLVSSAFISLSRGGIIAVSFSLLVFFAISAWKAARYSTLFYLLVFAGLFLSVTWFGWQPIVDRFESIINASGQVDIGRFAVWSDSLRVIKDFWLTGSGFGTFIAIFPLYRTFSGSEIYDHAHNDYLELLTDGGIIGFALVAWFVLAVIREGWRMIIRRRDRYSRLMSIGALSGIIAMLIHSLSDFNMHNGADGLYFFFLCGLLVSAGNTRFYYQMDATLLKKERWLSRRNVLFAGGAFFCAVLFFQCGAMFARWKYAHVSDIYLNRQLSEEHLQKISLALKQAAQFDPFEGIYPALQGDVQRYLGQPAKALEYYMLAGRKDPLDGAYLQQIAMMLPQDQHERAERLMAQGSKRTVKKDDLLLSRAQWLLDTSQRERAIDVLRQGLEENIKLVNSVLSLLDGFSLTREELAVLLPKSVEVWLQSAHFFENNGKAEDAAFLRRHALDFLDHEETIRPEWFSQLYNSFKKQKDDEKALEVLRLGISKLPRYPRFHEWLGDYYAKEGIVYRAQEEYQQVLLLEPLNESVRRKVEKVSKPQ